MSEAGFFRCPECGSVETERRLRCPCGYAAPALAPRTGAARERQPFVYHAAHYSAIFPIGALFATCLGSCMLGHENSGAIAFAFMCLIALLLVGSIVFGVIALFGVPQHGPGRLVVRAFFGIGFSICQIAWWIWSFLHW